MENIPPKRRSQEESIRLDAKGNWYHGEYPILHDRTVQFLHRNINVDKNGRFFLSGEDKPVFFSVDDVPYFVTKIEKTIAGFLIHLTDETIELLNLEAIWSGPKQDALYCFVKGGEAAAKFFRMPYYEITRGMIEEHGNHYIPFGSKKYLIDKKVPKAFEEMNAAATRKEVKVPSKHKKRALEKRKEEQAIKVASKKSAEKKAARKEPAKKVAVKKAAKKTPAKKAPAKKKPVKKVAPKKQVKKTKKKGR